MPNDQKFNEFFDTALLLNNMQTNTDIMLDVFAKVEQMIKDKDLDKAEVVLADSYHLEEWRNAYGTQMTIGLAYCRLFKEESKRKDTANIRASLEVLTEQKIMDCSEFYQQMAFDVDNELERLELVQEPDDEEIQLQARVDEGEKNRDPDLQAMYDLACHQIAKNRLEESVDLLLDIIAIDRNWNKRAA